MSHVYISDLDGTLLDRSATLPATAVERLNRLLADGLEFTVASARGVPAMQQVLQGLELKLPVVGFNGAFLSDLATGRHEVIHSIASDLAAELRHLMTGFGVEPLIATWNGSEDRVYHGEPQNEGETHYLLNRAAAGDPRLRPLDDVARVLAEDVVCLTGIGRRPPLEALAARIEEIVGDTVEIHLFENQYSPGWFWLTLHDRNATKDRGVRELIRSRRLENRSIVVFGDERNDLKLFAMADRAVAVANAVPEIIASATHVIGHHDDGSVVDYIESHYAGQARPASEIEEC